MIETKREFENELNRITISYPLLTSLVTQGKSMQPIVEPNHLASFRDYKEDEEVRVGDIVVFFQDGQHIIKQISAIIPTYSFGEAFEVHLQGTNREVSKDYVLKDVIKLKHKFKRFIKFPYEQVSDNVIRELGGQV